jgi:hypothetical protein
MLSSQLTLHGNVLPEQQMISNNAAQICSKMKQENCLGLVSVFIAFLHYL